MTSVRAQPNQPGRAKLLDTLDIRLPSPEWATPCAGICLNGATDCRVPCTGMKRRLSRVSVIFVLLASAFAAEPGPGPDPKAPGPDPTTAVVAEGQYLYRQRDLDALVLVAQRYAKQKLSRPEEDQLRQVLLVALPGREALLAALERLPASLAGKARDQFILDLLEYQAEKGPPRAPGASEPLAGAPISNQSGPVLVRLPDLILIRQLDGLGRRQLALSLAFNFADTVTSKRFEAKAPILQDAILGYIHGLSPTEFAEPNHVALKTGLTKAIQGALPDFPSDAILIPQLDVTIPDGK
jgi:hypothetical protein